MYMKKTLLFPLVCRVIQSFEQSASVLCPKSTMMTTKQY